MADNPARRTSNRRPAASKGKLSGRQKAGSRKLSRDRSSGGSRKRSGEIKAVKRGPKRRGHPSASGKISAVRKSKRVSEQAVVGEGEPGTELELEVVQASFQRGLPIAAKIAIVTAALLAVACIVLGVVVADITTKSVEAEINYSGVAMCNVLDRSMDHFWVATEDYRTVDNYTTTEHYHTRKERVQQRLNQLINDPGSADQIYNVIILEPDKTAYLVSAIPADKVSQGTAVELESPVGDIDISELEVTIGAKSVLVRRFEKRIGQWVEPEDFDDEEREEGVEGPSEDAVFEYKVLNILLSAERIEEVGRNLQLRTMIAAVVVILMGVALSIVMASFFTAPIRVLVQDVETVSGGDLEHKTEARSRDEIGLLAETFDIMTRNLKVAQDAEAKKKSIEHELNIAKEIQTKLLPERIPKIPGYSMHAYYQSAREIGGDYYDFIIIDEHHLGIIVADVSGKGIPASMVMTMTRSLIRLASHRNTSAQDTLRKVNRILAKDIRRGMFVTAAYMVLDIRTRNLKICSAGHNPLLLYRAASRTLESIKPKGMALGFDKGPAFDKSLEEKDVTLRPGDCLVAYTDGVVEAMNDAKEEYGETQLEAIVTQHAALPVERFVEQIVASLQEHRGMAEQSDDITITTLSVS